MTLKAAIGQIMKLKGFTYAIISEKAGYKSHSGVSERIRQGNMKIDTLIRLAKTMDYEVVLRSKLKDKTEWVITDESSKGVDSE